MGLTYAEAKALGLSHLWPTAVPKAGREATPVPPVTTAELDNWMNPGPWIMEIPGWRPTLDNELKRNPLAAHSLKRRDADVIARANFVYRIPRATCRRRLTLTISNRFGRLPDDPAPLKSLWDALVTNNLLVDDSREWLEMVYPPTYVRGSKMTTIVLEDI